MNASDLRKAFLDFFEARGHAIIPSASLIPENDPSVLFTTAGMHPLVPHLLGQPHPKGRRLANVQKCFRTTDIDDVGDDRHCTFFEMMGNWSLGDYFKKESLAWSYEFLTKILKFDFNKIHVTVFAGDDDAPRDDESARIWASLGVPKERIHFLPKDDNWWASGETGPCGPDSEIFIDTGNPECGPDCRPGCKCAKYLEVWNNVFMEFNKTAEGRIEPLSQKNIDTGMGVERTIAILSGKDSVYKTPLFAPLIEVIKSGSKEFNDKSARVMADHIRSATFILGDERGVTPSNTGQGYILRRLIRRAIRHGRTIQSSPGLIQSLSNLVIDTYLTDYPVIASKREFIINELTIEETKFLKTLERGLKMFERLVVNDGDVSGTDAFLLFQSYGFPIEMTEELAREGGVSVDVAGFNEEYSKHKELSSAGAGETFKGGLRDASAESVKLHTVTHMLAEALRRALNADIKQKGSNITPERLRFDFNFDRKLTPEELSAVESLINEQISKSLPVIKQEMTFEEAKSLGAHAEFEGKYGERVFVYSIGDFSKEVCGGPHVNNTSELGTFKILKEESSAAGVRRIKAVIS